MNGTYEQHEPLPEALIEELRRLDRAPEAITSKADRAVSKMARAHFAARRTPVLRRQGAWGAAACALLVVTLATSRLVDRVDAPVYADVDGSGRIDIADVLALARSGQDIEQADLDAFAFRLVAVERAGRS